MLKNKGSQVQKKTEFYRRVFQVSPEDRERIEKTSKKAISNTQVSSEKVICGSDSKHRSRHRDVYFPLLIKIYSLQEQIHNIKSKTHVAFPDQAGIKKPLDIKEDLQHIIDEIEESQRWNEGVISQAKKSLQELQELLPEKRAEEKSWIKRLMQKLRKHD